MKPMLKATFFSLVTDLLTRKITPTIKWAKCGADGTINWSEADGTSCVEPLYRTNPSSAHAMRKRFDDWFADVVNMHQVQLVASAGITVGCCVWDELFYKQRTVTAIRADGMLELDAEVERRLDQVKALLPDEPEVEEDAFDLKAINAQFNKENGESMSSLTSMLHAAMDRMECTDAHAEALRVAQNINDMINIGVSAQNAMAVAFEMLQEHDEAHALALELDELIQRQAYSDECQPALNPIAQRNRQYLWENTWSYAYRVERFRAAHSLALACTTEQIQEQSQINDR